MKRAEQNRLQELRSYRDAANSGWVPGRVVFAPDGEPWHPPEQVPGRCSACGYKEQNTTSSHCVHCFPRFNEVMTELDHWWRGIEARRKRCEGWRDYRRARDASIRDEVPPKYWDLWFRTYIPADESQVGAVEQLRKWASDPTALARYPFFYLCGPVGVGKTGLSIPALRLYSREIGIPTFFSEVDFVDQWQRAHEPGYAGPSPQRLVDFARTKHLLVWDDMGKAKLTDAWSKVVFQIMSYRDDHLLPTLITSNFEPASLVQRVGEPVADRVTARIVWRIGGKSRRAAA